MRYSKLKKKERVEILRQALEEIFQKSVHQKEEKTKISEREEKLKNKI